jgi:hypothetical protein
MGGGAVGRMVGGVKGAGERGSVAEDMGWGGKFATRALQHSASTYVDTMHKAL